MLADKGIILAYLPDTITLAVPSSSRKTWTVYPLPMSAEDKSVSVRVRLWLRGVIQRSKGRLPVSR